jgi:ATP-binding cassette subfamily B protein
MTFTVGGAACFALATFYKPQLPIARIRQYASTDKGTNVLGMIEAAQQLGFR